MRSRVCAAVLVSVVLSAVACTAEAPAPTQPATAVVNLPSNLVGQSWDDATQWVVGTDNKSTIVVKAAPGVTGGALGFEYRLDAGGGWVQARKAITVPWGVDIPLVFYLKTEGTGDLELKLVDQDGSTFGRKIPLAGQYKNWTAVVLYPRNVEYWWGGDDALNEVKEFYFAVSGKGQGTLFVDEVGFGKAGLEPSFASAGPQIDPNAKMAGIGAQQRRDSELTPEDAGVLEWLKRQQDGASSDSALVPSMEDNEAQTFNNALVAMAFIVSGERERAERILDFYAASTVRGNRCLPLQNFFYKNQARGYYQFVTLNAQGAVPAYVNPGNADRWMGDMAWLLIACKYHEKTYGGNRYAELSDLLKKLLVEWYTDDPEGGGYVRHGWRHADAKLHESSGHEEGNIDAYAAFRLCGENAMAAKIRTWLDRKIQGNTRPLDHFSWRVLAYGRDSASLLDIPEFDFRYRKKVTFQGREVWGFFHGPDNNISNIWTDGTGHIAAAYLSCGDRERGNYYANQLDRLLIDRTINGVKVRALPYAANTTGGYDWVKQDRGFASCAAWYIFAKNRFNPLRLEHGE